MFNFSRRKCTYLLLTAVTVSTVIFYIEYETNKSEFYRIKRNSKQLPSLSMQALIPYINKIVQCTDKDREPALKMRGIYLVFYNYVKATRDFKCHESITYTTIGDFSFLINLKVIAERWRGPVSVAVYAPGDDFHMALDTIAYLRNCLDSSLIKELVTFHLYLNSAHLPFGFDDIYMEMYEDNYKCSKGPPYGKVGNNETYKSTHNLLFPINVGRNVARLASQTHFVLASDIELYPSLNFIKNFLTMVAYNSDLFEQDRRAVFVLPVFEVLEYESIPNTKTELQAMFQSGRAFWFHKKICSVCHTIPEEDEWMKEPESHNLNALVVAKRYGQFKIWEPFYVGTNHDPIFDERLTWEGRSNKMSQAYEMCLLLYDYMVLNNAFLVHTPGVKVLKPGDLDKRKTILAETETILDKIKKEMISKHGRNRKCFLSLNRH